MSKSHPLFFFQVHNYHHNIDSAQVVQEDQMSVLCHSLRLLPMCSEVTTVLRLYHFST